MDIILKQLGLTPEIIARHVVSIDRRKPQYKELISRNASMTKLRAQRRLAGQNVNTGLPLQRSPNGTRKGITP
jgi:hypothetical protein